MIERCGKFSRLAAPGFNTVCCPWETVVGKISYRVQQLDVRVETKTADNVFITAVVSIQYQVLKEKVRGSCLIRSCFILSASSAYQLTSPSRRLARRLAHQVYEAFYSLTNPAQQITAHVYDVMRSQLPTLELDAVFEAKEELAVAVKTALQGTMSRFGFQILQALITDLDPDNRVKQAMNEINASKRMKFAVAEQAEGQKILQVKSAEAEAESKYLSGVGVAKQRRAIVDGLRGSIVDFSTGVEGTTAKDVMDLLLLSQYFDMLRDTAGQPNCKTVFVPSSKTMGDDVRNAMMQSDAIK